MKSEWRLESNFIGNEKYYRVVRIKDVNEVDHSGNREYATEYMICKEKAQKIVDILNGEKSS
jgi:hypothetical protein